jgi:hypothetical protein
MKHLKSFNEKAILSESMSTELPEGYALDIFSPRDRQAAMEHFEKTGAADWSGLTFDEWFDSLDELGTIQYADGKEYFRGVIKWPEMGVDYVYEIHPI